MRNAHRRTAGVAVDTCLVNPIGNTVPVWGSAFRFSHHRGEGLEPVHLVPRGPDRRVALATGPEAAKISFSIDLGSAALGSAETEAGLAKAEWFNTKLFPQATFQSSAVKAVGPGEFEVAGKLVIKGSSHDLVVPLVLAQTAGRMTASGTFAVRRLGFKIGDGAWKDTAMVAGDVQVKFKLMLSGVSAL